METDVHLSFPESETKLTDCPDSAKKKRFSQPWTPEEDKKLLEAIERHGGKNWKRVADSLLTRTHTQCLHRWQKVLNPKLVKGAWSKEEDDVLRKAVSEKGPGNWSEIAKQLNGRIGKQCRERWYNHLDPSIQKSPWTKEEDEKIILAHKKYGNAWATIAKELGGGRPSNSIKNHWNSNLRFQVEGIEKKRKRETQKSKGKKKSKQPKSESSTNLNLVESVVRDLPDKMPPVDIPFNEVDSFSEYFLSPDDLFQNFCFGSQSLFQENSFMESTSYF